jgi:hypothetical protein
MEHCTWHEEAKNSMSSKRFIINQKSAHGPCTNVQEGTMATWRPEVAGPCREQMLTHTGSTGKKLNKGFIYISGQDTLATREFPEAPRGQRYPA